MAGAAVAFAVGVQFAPRASCPNPGYGSVCPGKKHFPVKRVNLSGFGNIRGSKGHIRLSFTNKTGTRVRLKLVIVVQNPAGKKTTITKITSLAPGKTFKLDRVIGFKKIHAAKLTLTITDSAGDHATITKQVGKFKPVPKPKHKHAKR